MIIINYIVNYSRGKSALGSPIKKDQISEWSIMALKKGLKDIKSATPSKYFKSEKL